MKQARPSLFPKGGPGSPKAERKLRKIRPTQSIFSGQPFASQDQGFDLRIDVTGKALDGLPLPGDLPPLCRDPLHDFFLHSQGGAGIGKLKISSAPIFHMPTAVLALDWKKERPSGVCTTSPTKAGRSDSLRRTRIMMSGNTVLGASSLAIAHFAT